MTIRSNAVERIVRGLLARVNASIANDLCDIVDNYHDELFNQLRSDMNSLNRRDPQAIQEYINKWTDYKVLNSMLLACQRSSRPRRRGRPTRQPQTQLVTP